MKKGEKIFLIYLAVFLLGLFLFIQFRNSRLEKDGRFTLGIVEEVASSKSGKIYFVHYFFKGQSYKISFSDVGHQFYVNQLLFIKIDNNSPKLFDVLSYLETTVPVCFKISNAPANGWKTLPKDTCDSK